LLLQPGHTASVPGKVYEYLASGRPILAIAEEGDLSRLVRGSGAGELLAADDQEGIVNALSALTHSGGAAVSKAPLDLFDGNARAAEIATVLEGFLAGSASLNGMLPNRRNIC
jgi:hypothetical protein